MNPVLVIDLLRRRVRALGGDPLVTYYDLASGERTELSARSMANWVDKTSNLLVDELALDAGERLELDLARTHPAHWVTFVWELACWQVGIAVTVDGPGHGSGDSAGPGTSSEPPGAVVVGPDAAGLARRGTPVLACSLHPFALPLPQRPQAPVLDYTLEVRAQPDVFAGAPASGADLAWVDRARSLSQSELVAAGGGPRPGTRRLVQDTDPWSAASALVEALATDGSLVVVVGQGEQDQVGRIAHQERVTGLTR